MEPTPPPCYLRRDLYQERRKVRSPVRRENRTQVGAETRVGICIGDLCCLAFETGLVFLIGFIVNTVVVLTSRVPIEVPTQYSVPFPCVAE